MAKVTQSNLTTGISSGTGATTSSVSPVPNQIVIVTVLAFNNSTSPNTPTLSGCSITWNQIVTEATTQRNVTSFVGVSSSPTAGVLTISFGGQSEGAIQWSVDQFANTRISNGGLDAIVQNNKKQSTSTGSPFTVTLSAFANINNATYGAIQLSANTPSTNMTSIFTTGSSNWAWSNANQTSVSWTFSGTVLATAIAFEIAFGLQGGFMEILSI